LGAVRIGGVGAKIGGKFLGGVGIEGVGPGRVLGDVEIGGR